MDSWPENLPQDWYLADNGPDYKPADSTIRSSVTAGPAKLRRRWTAAPETVTLTGHLDEAELKILRDFVKITLKEALPFGWKDFRTGDAANYRFFAGWSSVGTKHYGDCIWTVSLQLEMLP